MRFVREKKLRQGKSYMTVKIYDESTLRTKRLPKFRRRKIQPPKYISANDKRAKETFIALLNANFADDGGYRLDLTYSGQPPTAEQAMKDRQNLCSRLSRLYKKHGAVFRWVAVTEGGRPKKDGGFTRIHHHLVISNGVPREEIEAAWSKGRRSCQHLQINPGDNGLEPLARYLLKHERQEDEKCKCRWSGSRNLKKPEEQINDSAYTIGERERLAKAEADGTLKEKLEKRYKGFEVISYSVQINKITGWMHVDVKLHRRN